MLSPALWRQTSRAIGRLHELIDRDAAELEQRDPRFRCPAHCSVCCLGNVFFITALDFLYVCDYVAAQLPPETTKEIVETALNQAAECGTEEALRLETGKGREPLALVQRCPLLDEGRCLVYPARPVACRAHGRTRFADGRLNVCDLIFERLDGGPPSHDVTVMESYSRALAQLLTDGLGLDRLAMIEPYVAVSTIPVFIARTRFEPALALSACAG